MPRPPADGGGSPANGELLATSFDATKLGHEGTELIRSKNKAHGMRTIRPFAAMKGIRFIFKATSLPCRDFDNTKPVPPVAAIAGTKIHRPGDTISLFT